MVEGVIHKINTLAESVQKSIEERAHIKVSKVAESLEAIDAKCLPELEAQQTRLTYLEELLSKQAYPEIIDAFYGQKPDDKFP